MANRHLARSVVLQTLFEWDTIAAHKDAAADMLARNAEEFGGDSTDRPFMEQLLKGVLAKCDDLNLIIEKAAPDWPLDKIAPVDRNILRIGLYELLFADRSQVPAKVAINEAIELAKTFGGESSGRFVNGVLGAVYKEIGEPGKDEIGKKKMVRREDLPIEHLAGAVVYAKHEGQLYWAVVHDVFGHWTLSKGKVEDGPDQAGTSIPEAAKREMKEELGLDVVVGQKIGENEYVASHPEKGKYRKHVTYFIAESPYTEINLKQTGGLDDARWFKLPDILELNFYDDLLPIVTAAVQTLLDRARAAEPVAQR